MLQTFPLKPDLLNIGFFFPYDQIWWRPFPWKCLTCPDLTQRMLFALGCSSWSPKPLQQLVLGLAASGKALLLGWRLSPHCIEFRFKNQWVGSSSLLGEPEEIMGKGSREQQKYSVHCSASLLDVQTNHCNCILCMWFSKSISEFMESR